MAAAWWRCNVSPLLGILAVVSSILLHPSVLTWAFAMGASVSSPKRRAALFLVELLLLLFAAWVWWKRPRITTQEVLMATAGTALSLAVVEVALRLTGLPMGAQVGWRSTAPPAESNQLGFRGQPIRYDGDDMVVVLLGDSHVEAIACSYGWMPERRLERYLQAQGRKVKVFSVAASGWGQDQQLLAMREYYDKYRADLVLLWATPGNDVWNNMFPTHWGTLKPTFVLKDDALIEPLERLAEPLRSPGLRLFALWRRVVLTAPDAEWERRLPPAYRPLTEYAGTANMSWQQRWDDGMRSENVEAEKTAHAMGFTPRSPRMEYGLRLTRALLGAIAGTVRAHGGRFVVFRHEPDRRVVNPWADGPGPDVYFLNSKYYRSSDEQWRRNVDFLNGGFESLVVPVTIDDWYVGPQNPHLNTHATDQVMRDLATALGDSLLPQRRRATTELTTSIRR